MYICTNCKRYFKSDCYTCAKCGSSQLEKVSDLAKGEFDTPPDGGYIVNLKDYDYEIENGTVTLIVGCFFVACAVNDYFASRPNFSTLVIILLLFFIIFAAWCIITGASTRIKANKSKRKVEALSKNGLLIKGLPYQIELVERSFKNVKPIQAYRIKVFYKNNSGLESIFISNKKLDNNDMLSSSYDTADLLLDPNDYSNYFVDFEIY